MVNQKYRKSGWQLDKDLIDFKNKLYCPDKCIFIPVSINKALTTNNSDSLIGIKKRGNKFIVSISIDGKNTYFGSYDSIEEAKSIYKENKLKYLYTLGRKEGVPSFIMELFERYINSIQEES